MRSSDRINCGLTRFWFNYNEAFGQIVILMRTRHHNWLSIPSGKLLIVSSRFGKSPENPLTNYFYIVNIDFSKSENLHFHLKLNQHKNVNLKLKKFTHKKNPSRNIFTAELRSFALQNKKRFLLQLQTRITYFFRS